MNKLNLGQTGSRHAGRVSSPVGAFLFLALATVTASADEGAIEINATCAIQTGCLPGDSPGYPVTIAAGAGPTRFSLTSDLALPLGVQANAVLIERRNTTLDLGGFRVITELCRTASGPGCDPGGNFAGIQVFSGDTGVTIRNGSIVGFGGGGIRAGGRVTVSRVDVRWNGGTGIETDAQAQIEWVRSIDNVGVGIDVEEKSIVRGSLALGNLIFGITAGAGSLLDQNLSARNGSLGISISDSVVQACAAVGNGASLPPSDGMRVLGGLAESVLILESGDDGLFVIDASVRHAVSSGNGARGISAGAVQIEGSAVRSNGGDGIALFMGRVTTNAIRESGGNGLRAEGPTAFGNNTITGFTQSSVVGGTDVGGNACDGGGCP